MQDGLYVPVIGPSAILPRGYLWLAPIWYLAIAAALALSPWPPIWFRLAAAAGLLGAMIVFLLVLNSITTHAFAATREGIDPDRPAALRRPGGDDPQPGRVARPARVPARPGSPGRALDLAADPVLVPAPPDGAHQPSRRTAPV